MAILVGLLARVITEVEHHILRAFEAEGKNVAVAADVVRRASSQQPSFIAFVIMGHAQPVGDSDHFALLHPMRSSKP